MSDSSRSNFEKIRSEYSLVFDAIRRASEKFGFQAFLIGAQCRDVWAGHVKGDKRVTTDIDYALLLESEELWNSVKEYLVKNESVRKDEKLPYRFYLGEVMLDLIPFGGIARNGEVTLRPPEMVFSVAGMREMSDLGAVEIDGVWMATLPGLCVLKLIAYAEKPAARYKDFQDFEFILRSAAHILAEEVFDDTVSLEMITGGIDTEIVAANLLARRMRAVIGGNKEQSTKICGILRQELKGNEPDEIIAAFKNGKRNEERIMRLRLLVEALAEMERQ